MQNKLVTAKTQIFGEGCISPTMIGSLWISKDDETPEISEARYARAMKDMGLLFYPEGTK